MSTKFDNLVEANEIKENFGASVCMPEPAEPVSNPNARGSIQHCSVEQVKQRALKFASRIKS